MCVDIHTYIHTQIHTDSSQLETNFVSIAVIPKTLALIPPAFKWCMEEMNLLLQRGWSSKKSINTWKIFRHNTINNTLPHSFLFSTALSSPRHARARRPNTVPESEAWRTSENDHLNNSNQRGKKINNGWLMKQNVADKEEKKKLMMML